LPASSFPIVFVAPFLASATSRFVESVAGLPGVRLGLVTQEPVERTPPVLRAGLAAHWRVDDALDPDQIAHAVQQLSGRIGPATRLLGALEQLQLPLAQVRDSLGIEGMRPGPALNFRDKSRMKEVFRQAAIPCARFRLSRTPGDALEFAEQVGLPVVAKPPAGAAARNTFRVESDADLRELLRVDPPSDSRPVLFEEFIVGEEHSFDAVSLGGRMVWHSLTHYAPGPLEVLEHPWIQWTVLLPREIDDPRYDDIRRVGAETLSALGMTTGLSHLEWFRRRDGSVAVSEVAARPPGAQFTTLISYAHDVDFYRVWARLMVFDEFTQPERRYSAGLAFLRGQGRGRVRRILGLDQAQAELGSLVAEVRLPREGQLPASSYEGDGYVVLRHPRTDVVARALKRLVSLVRVELEP
jgi:hypothetical protein